MVSGYRLARTELSDRDETIRRLHRTCFPHDAPLRPRVGWWWIVWHGGEAVGFAGSRLSHQWSDAVYLCSAGVLPEHRGKRLQSRLIRARLQHAQSIGMRWAKARADEGDGPMTVGMELSKLGTALTYGALHLRLAPPGAVAAARPLLKHAGLVGPGVSRTRRINAEEERAILDHSPHWFSEVFRFALASAMRRGEIVRLLWSDVNLQDRTILVRDRKDPRKKKGNHMEVPLIGAAREVVSARPSGGLVFPYKPEAISDTMLVITGSLGIEDMVFHDTRHEATSRLFEMGLDIPRVAIVTGHKDWRHLKRYVHLTAASVHEALVRPLP